MLSGDVSGVVSFLADGLTGFLFCLLLVEVNDFEDAAVFRVTRAGDGVTDVLVFLSSSVVGFLRSSSICWHSLMLIFSRSR